MQRRTALVWCYSLGLHLSELLLGRKRVITESTCLPAVHTNLRVDFGTTDRNCW